jgi:predicted PurR-regulated permease PerM
MFRKVEISHRTIIFAALFLLGLWFLYIIRDIIFALFISFLLMTILDPIVARLTKGRFPRILSIFITYIVLMGIMVGTVVGILPPLVDQTTNFINNFPTLLENPVISSFINMQTINQLVSQLGSLPAQVLRIGVSVFSNLLALLSVLIFTFYMLLYRDRLDEQFSSVFGEKWRRLLIRMLNKIENSIGSWVRGQLILMIVLGVLVYIGLLILQIPYALPLAIFTGVLEIVPTIGIVIAAIPIVIIGLSISPLLGLGSVIMVIILHALEGYVLVPKVMEKSAGVNPLVTLTSLAVGLRVAGVVGALVSVPVVLMLQTVAKEYLRNK